MADEVPWDAQTDQFVADIDDVVTKEYGISFRDLLLNPSKFRKNQKAKDAMPGIKAEVDSYFDNIAKTMDDEKKKLESELDAANVQYDKIDEVIHIKSSALKVPYIKPLFVNRNVSSEETITVENYDEALDQMIGRLINVSHYVADVSVSYKDYMLGTWIFSGPKNYILTINQPVSYLFTLEGSNRAINTLLETAGNILG